MRDRVIFVEGVGRSGTTWLVSLFGVHPLIAAMSNESHLFDVGLDRLFENHGRNDRRFLSAYVSRSDLVDLTRDLSDGVLLRMREAAKPSASFVAENTPVPTSGRAPAVVSRKFECYPDAWYVHIVRDGNAVARSLARMPWMEGRSEKRCYQLWQRGVEAIRDGLRVSERYRELSYAELQADPAGCMAELVEWIGPGADASYGTAVVEASKTRYDVWAGARRADRMKGIVGRGRTAWRKGIARVGRAPAPDGSTDQSVEAARAFMDALRHPSDERWRACTTETVSATVTSASPSGVHRLTATGDAARVALRTAGRRVFEPRLVRETWSASSGVWLRSDAIPSITGILSGTRGDGSRVDLFLALVLLEGRVHRATLFVADGIT